MPRIRNESQIFIKFECISTVKNQRPTTLNGKRYSIVAIELAKVSRRKCKLKYIIYTHATLTE